MCYLKTKLRRTILINKSIKGQQGFAVTRRLVERFSSDGLSAPGGRSASEYGASGIEPELQQNQQGLSRETTEGLQTKLHTQDAQGEDQPPNPNPPAQPSHR